MTRPFLLGLTGSIGMGKSTTAALFAEVGVPVWDADETVHRLYGPGMPGAAAVAAIFPDAVTGQGVDRQMLKRAIASDPSALDLIERAIHPLVAADRSAFIARHASAPLVLLDIPLLFETGGDAELDAVLVVTAPPSVQRERVLARPGMDEGALASILARQMPDQEKRRKADFVIETHRGLDRARAEVLSVIEAIREGRRA